jgi:hypothetical protein
MIYWSAPVGVVDPEGCKESKQTGLGYPIIILGGVIPPFSLLFWAPETFEAELLIFFMILMRFY